MKQAQNYNVVDFFATAYIIEYVILYIIHMFHVYLHSYQLA